MTWSVPPQSWLSAMESAPSPSTSHSGSSHSEYSTIFHLCTSMNPFPTPTDGSKCKADDLGDNNCQAKQQRSLQVSHYSLCVSQGGSRCSCFRVSSLHPRSVCIVAVQGKLPLVWHNFMNVVSGSWWSEAVMAMQVVVHRAVLALRSSHFSIWLCTKGLFCPAGA